MDGRRTDVLPRCRRPVHQRLHKRGSPQTSWEIQAPASKPLSGYEDEYRNVPVNERPFLLFQRDGSPTQHGAMEQAALELYQESRDKARLYGNPSQDEREDETFGAGADGSEEGQPKDWGDSCKKPDDPTVMRDFHVGVYGSAVQKAAGKYGVSAEVLLAIAEQEKRGAAPKFTIGGGNGVTQVQRNNYLQYLKDSGQISKDDFDREADIVKSSKQPFSAQWLEDKYYNDVNGYDSCFDITGYHLKKLTDKHGPEEAVRMYNQGEAYQKNGTTAAANPTNGKADAYYEGIAARVGKYRQSEY